MSTQEVLVTALEVVGAAAVTVGGLNAIVSWARPICARNSISWDDTALSGAAAFLTGVTSALEFVAKVLSPLAVRKPVDHD